MDRLRSNCGEQLTLANRNQKTVSRFRKANGSYILYVGHIGSTHHVFQAEEAPEVICNFKYSNCWGEKDTLLLPEHALQKELCASNRNTLRSL